MAEPDDHHPDCPWQPVDQPEHRTPVSSGEGGAVPAGGRLVRRQRNGALNLYADVVDAQLTVPDAWGEGGHFEPGVTLTLICLPDFYGDEISLDSVSATGVYTGVAAISGTAATILGDHPSRCRSW